MIVKPITLPNFDWLKSELVRSPGVHASEIYGDLFRRLEPKRYDYPDDGNPMLMVLGTAWERHFEYVLKVNGIEVERPDEFMSPEGIAYSPDLIIFNGKTRVGEIKYTSMSADDMPSEVTNNLPAKLDKYMCVSPSTKLLTSDLRWVFAGEVKAGDRLIAFDEFGSPKRHLRHTTVLKARTIVKPSARLEMADGSEIECSLDHRWFIKTHSGDGRWERTDALLATDQKRGAARKQNFSLCRVCPVGYDLSALDERSIGWLGGLFDGEGSLGKYGEGALRLSVAQNKGPVLAHLKRLLKDDKFSVFSTGDTCESVVLATQADIWRFLALTRPLRLMQKFKSLPDIGGFSYDRVRVARRIPLGDRPVVAIETDTHTYIAEGFASHNCQMKLYAYWLGVNDGWLAVLFNHQPWNPQFRMFDIHWTDDELRDNHAMCLNHWRAMKEER